MQFRRSIQQHGTLIGLLAAAIVIGSALYIAWLLGALPTEESSRPKFQGQAYFYDQNTGKLFSAPAAELGPIETDSGPYNGMPAGVRARVFACRSCDDPARRIVGWLEIPIQALAKADPGSYAQYLDEDQSAGEVAVIMIRGPEDEHWVPIESPAGGAVIAAARGHDCPSGERLHRCRAPAKEVR